MGHFDSRLHIYRSLQVEPCEPRLVLAHPTTEMPAIQTSVSDETSILAGHQVAGVAYAHALGLSGHGQTVAIIDSGIAYDHQALGGGFGTGHRVVGGWDFTDENDADPFDDAPAGLHGTHIAGILASADTDHPGVAPEVDLVALRVFNDQGEGSFEWIENALRWVIDNRQNFEHPITTVNLSLGTKWQGEEVPQWAVLENEFSELHEQGIFVAVAAGNGFRTRPVVGLSYPATSPHVVAVASHDSKGELSNFSRRSDRVLVAPGENITSTAPDYLYDFNGITDDFFTASGTSMATPFVSGASILIREALERTGATDVSVETIHQILQGTAQQTFDERTDRFYSHVDLQAALESIAPIDDYGSAANTAHALGQIGSSHSVTGNIEIPTDVDYFSFSPAQSGTIRLQIDQASQLAPRWYTDSLSAENGKVIDIEVRAHQRYTIGIGSDSGVGEYSFTASLQPPTIELGAIGFSEITTTGGAIYEFTTERAGILAISVSADTSPPNRLNLFQDMDQVTSNQPFASVQHRLDLDVDAGDSFYFESTSPTRITLANIVSIEGNELNIFGTSQDDNFFATLGPQASFSVNGLTFDLSKHEQSSVQFHGEQGNDVLRIYLSDQNESVTVTPSTLQVRGSNLRIQSVDFEKQYIYAGDGNDTAYLYDSIADDQFTGLPHYSVLSGPTFFNYVEGFSSVQAYSIKGGLDRARLFDSSDDDTFTGQTSYSLLAGQNFRNYVEGFRKVRAYSHQGGHDTAVLYDSHADDTYHGLPNYSLLTTPKESRYVEAFESVKVHAIFGGMDHARLYDSPFDDTLFALPEYSLIEGHNFRNYARGFDQVRAYSQSGGHDIARLYDSAANDEFTALPRYGVMKGVDFDNYAEGFALVRAYSNQGGIDVARFLDSDGNDTFHGLPRYAVFTGNGFDNYAEGFNRVRAYSHQGGLDEARLYGSTGDDQFDGLPEYSVIKGPEFDNYVEGFELVFADSNQGGFDEARLYDSVNDDVFIGSANSGILTGSSYRNAAIGFNLLQVHSDHGGRDRAFLSGQKTDRVFADTQSEKGFLAIAYRSRSANFDFQLASESSDLHRSLARLIARDDFYRSASAEIDSQDISTANLLQLVRSDDQIISAIGFDVVDWLLEDDQDWTP
ncbi:MAG: S8 family serine peptidase [Pirellulaceae bacterium]|nr:S8 family serine peptidase [Pirellulaceae bacterium]